MIREPRAIPHRRPYAHACANTDLAHRHVYEDGPHTSQSRARRDAPSDPTRAGRGSQIATSDKRRPAEQMCTDRSVPAQGSQRPAGLPTVAVVSALVTIVPAGGLPVVPDAPRRASFRKSLKHGLRLGPVQSCEEVIKLEDKRGSQVHVVRAEYSPPCGARGRPQPERNRGASRTWREL